MCALVPLNSAAADADVGLSARVGLYGVDNPFLEPLDPSLVEAVAASTAGLSGRASTDAGFWLRWLPGAPHRVDLTLDGTLDVWRGDASTWGWQAGAGLEYGYRIWPMLEAIVGGSGSAAAIDAFPADEIRWGEARAGLGVDLGAHRIGAILALGARQLPARTFVTDDGATGTGRDDTLLRIWVDHCARWSSARWCSSAGYDAVGVSDAGVDYDTLTLSTLLDVPLGPVDAGLRAAGWRRAFDAVDGALRTDLGGLLEARVSRRFGGFVVAARYRYLRSISDVPIGEFAQHLGGVEVGFTWSSVETSPEFDVQPATADAGWTFRHRAPDAGEVALAGDFNGWVPEPMTGPGADGWWSVSRALGPGRHSYMFVVDGAFIRPPQAPAYADDGFGGQVGVVYILDDEPAADRPSNGPGDI